MSRKKNYFIVLDTETCNMVEQPLPYDLGWVVCDRYGNIYERRSYVIKEIFIGLKDVMASAYYSKKIPMYWEDIKAGKRVVANMWDIRRVMMDDMKKYNICSVGAYNMRFDTNALNNLIRYVTKSWKRYWFPYGTKTFCIWNMACTTILNRITYKKFALQNGFVSEKDNIITSAECAYRYVTNKVDFAESHTGLEDVEIEVAIMAYCYRQHKKMNKNINPSCWRIVQKAA